MKMPNLETKFPYKRLGDERKTADVMMHIKGLFGKWIVFIFSSLIKKFIFHIIISKP